MAVAHRPGSTRGYLLNTLLFVAGFHREDQFGSPGASVR
jgi:hypothetical protein